MRAVERRWTVVWRLALAMAVGAGAAAVPAQAQTSGDEPRPRSMAERALESRAKGANDARVVVFEIADFQCPYCARFAATVGPELDRRYVRTGQVQWVFVNLPLHTHRLAWVAAEAALCAGAAGGRFWEMHDRLFAEQQRWSTMDDPAPLFAEMARELEVPDGEFRRCVAQDRVAPVILEDFGSAVSAGITGTPSFIIMRDDEVVEQVSGLQSVEEWARILDEVLRR